MILYLLGDYSLSAERAVLSKYGDKVSIEIAAQMNTHDAVVTEESIKNMFFCVEFGVLFSAGQLINSMRMPVPGGACRHLGRPPDTEPWSCHSKSIEHWWNQRSLWK